MVYTEEDLRAMQKWSLARKIQVTQSKIIEYHSRLQGQVYVSFSGGKDSTVLLDIARKIYPDIEAVFIDTGLEYPEIKEFVKTIPNVAWVKPAMTFNQVVEKYGYPVISKDQARAIARYRNTNDPMQKWRRLNGWPCGKKGMISKKWQFLVNAPFKISDECCNRLKKEPLDRYAKQNNLCPIMGTMAGESDGRKRQYLKTGCNVFYETKSKSMPLSIWNESDIWEYIKKFNLPYSSIYDKGAKRTGCMFCLFGAQFKNDNRFEILKANHPKIYDYCMNQLGLADVIKYIETNGGAKPMQCLLSFD